MTHIPRERRKTSVHMPRNALMPSLFLRVCGEFVRLMRCTLSCRWAAGAPRRRSRRKSLELWPARGWKWARAHNGGQKHHIFFSQFRVCVYYDFDIYGRARIIISSFLLPSLPQVVVYVVSEWVSEWPLRTGGARSAPNKERLYFCMSAQAKKVRLRARFNYLFTSAHDSSDLQPCVRTARATSRCLVSDGNHGTRPNVTRARHTFACIIFVREDNQALNWFYIGPHSVAHFLEVDLSK